MLVGVYCEVESWWVIVSFEGLFDCQMVFSGVWNGLSGHLLADCKADMCRFLFLWLPVINSPSISWRMLFLMVFLTKNLYRAITRFCCSGGVREGVQAEEVFVLLEAVTESLFWMIFLCCLDFWSFFFSRGSLFVLAIPSTEEVTPFNVCGWYHYRLAIMHRDCRFEMPLTLSFSDKRLWIFMVLLRH